MWALIQSCACDGVALPPMTHLFPNLPSLHCFQSSFCLSTSPRDPSTMLWSAQPPLSSLSHQPSLSAGAHSAAWALSARLVPSNLCHQCLFDLWLTAPADAPSDSKLSRKCSSFWRKNERVRQFWHCKRPRGNNLSFLHFLLPLSPLDTFLSPASFYSRTFPGGAAEASKQTHPM